MSGGTWNYANDTLVGDIFGWGLDVDYGLHREEHKVSAMRARKADPLEDKELSELVFDMFCLLHSYDWYNSADIGEDTYRTDVKAFKDKWLKRPGQQRIKDEIEKTLSEANNSLYRDFLQKLEDE